MSDSTALLQANTPRRARSRDLTTVQTGLLPAPYRAGPHQICQSKTENGGRGTEEDRLSAGDLALSQAQPLSSPTVLCWYTALAKLAVLKSWKVRAHTIFENTLVRLLCLLP